MVAILETCLAGLRAECSALLLQLLQLSDDGVESGLWFAFTIEEKRIIYPASKKLEEEREEKKAAAETVRELDRETTLAEATGAGVVTHAAAGSDQRGQGCRSWRIVCPRPSAT